jgi:integrase
MAAEDRTASLPALSPKMLEALRPEQPPLAWREEHPTWHGGDYDLPDSAAPGLVLRVTAKGRKVFRWQVRSLGRVITIGPWSKTERAGHVTLGQAHRWLERLKAAHAVGRLAELEQELATLRPKKSGNAPIAAPGTPTVSDVAKDFLKFIERRRKKPEEVRRSVEHEILPAIGSRPITSVTSRDVRNIVQAVVERGAPTQAGKVLAHAKQLFRFAQGRDDVPAGANPAYPLEAEALGVENNICQRVLTPEEIPAFWNALEKARLTQTVQLGLKVILLTGVRTCELLRARWEDVSWDEDKARWEKGQTEARPTWTIPVANQKLTRKQEQTARPWTVPLAPMAVELFKALQVLAQKSPFVMTSPHEPEQALTDKALVAAMRKLFVGEEPELDFAEPRPTPHDLRRTVRTSLGDKLGVPWHIAERCLNHSIGRITQTYDVGDYLTERRAALEKWDAYLQRLLSPAEASVAFLLTAARG